MSDSAPMRGRRAAGAGSLPFPENGNWYSYRGGRTAAQCAELDQLRFQLDARARKPWDDDRGNPTKPTAPRRQVTAAAVPLAGNPTPPRLPEPAPPAAPSASTPDVRCAGCGYMTSAIGHQIQCGTTQKPRPTAGED